VKEFAPEIHVVSVGRDEELGEGQSDNQHGRMVRAVGECKNIASEMFVLEDIEGAPGKAHCAYHS
jgi:hypothetical protein